MHDKTDYNIVELLKDETIENFDSERDAIRENSRLQIVRVQDENQRSFNKHRREASRYQTGDLVAVKRTQLGAGLKLKPKYLGPYQIVKVKSNDTYDVEREGTQEGPRTTTTCAEYIKPCGGIQNYHPRQMIRRRAECGKLSPVLNSPRVNAASFTERTLPKKDRRRRKVARRRKGREGRGRRETRD
ncbi:hypothetical protein ALC62_02873 [Cyphomyrmex costatus]|uniref:Uncharacterized protein n=1 Tax=Cyphomyrmex costatus TaxID=456900 RepID=A0A151IML2_9HYME|nr:hypothetical protein ALC62_02873 [Cyphomyrmex costatus]